jgi:hypothetical protein
MVPIFFSGVFAMGVIFVFSGAFTFLVECYELYAASALASNSFVRSYMAGAFPLFGVQMYESKLVIRPTIESVILIIAGLGYQWASTLLAFLALALAP